MQLMHHNYQWKQQCDGLMREVEDAKSQLAKYQKLTEQKLQEERVKTSRAVVSSPVLLCSLSTDLVALDLTFYGCKSAPFIETANYCLSMHITITAVNNIILYSIIFVTVTYFHFISFKQQQKRVYFNWPNNRTGQHGTKVHV